MCDCRLVPRRRECLDSRCLAVNDGYRASLHNLGTQALLIEYQVESWYNLLRGYHKLLPQGEGEEGRDESATAPDTTYQALDRSFAALQEKKDFYNASSRNSTSGRRAASRRRPRDGERRRTAGS